MTHPDTIGTVILDGKTYEIDWPHGPGEETTRDPYCAVVYHDGSQVSDLPLPGFGQPYTSASQIMQIATEYITEGGLND